MKKRGQQEHHAQHHEQHHEPGGAPRYCGNFNSHFKIFHELMPFKVREILLVSSPYDAYILEEEGSLATRIIAQYQGLSLSQPPRLTRAASPAQALTLLREQQFDLVLLMPHLGELASAAFGAVLKKRYPELPVILLAHSLRDTLDEEVHEGPPAIDDTYVWGGDAGILLAIVKNIEDRRNVASDTRKAMVRVIILVEDCPLYRSLLLPILYNELVSQTRAVLADGLGEQQRLLKMRARPKILTAASYEQAWQLCEKYRPYLFGVISDARFPRQGRVADDAGWRLLTEIRRHLPDVPLLMLSSDPANESRTMAIPALFTRKDSPRLREEIHAFFLNQLGFGDFIFRLPGGPPVGRAATLREFEEQLKVVAPESLRYHAASNHFSNWLMARAEVALAARLHQNRFRVIRTDRQLREDLLIKVQALRKIRQQGSVIPFRAKDYEPSLTEFVKIGQGSPGGKARGIVFFAGQLRQAARRSSLLNKFPVRVPPSCILGAAGFDDFVRLNNLHPPLAEEEDHAIDARFLAAALPAWLETDLRAFLLPVTYPLSVRSSSILEDAQFRPYAGLYRTFMLANDHPEFEVRFAGLCRAIKLVYASTWHENPRAFAHAFARDSGQLRRDSMAVIIQQLAGSRHGAYFYPALSGVAQSYNYYPLPPMRAEDGIAHIALGFGKTVVEGGRSLRFSPPYPQNLPQFSTVDDILANAQRWFYALDCGERAAFAPENGNLVRREIEAAAAEYPVRLLCSTYFPEEHRIRDGDLAGHKILTFAPLLKYGIHPLPELLAELLALGRQGLGCEVEIEFCLDLKGAARKNTLYFLQIRPIATGSDTRAVQISDPERAAAFVHSTAALGHGVYENMRDILYVVPERFTGAVSRQVAREVGQLNRYLVREKTPYLLLGPGRWGTLDPWLGIPVRWEEISGVGAIGEWQGDQLWVEPSQGTHFFQNITALGIPYLLVRLGPPAPGAAEAVEKIDWTYVNTLQMVRQTEYVRHVRMARPFVLKVNGRTSEAVALAPAHARVTATHTGHEQ